MLQKKAEEENVVMEKTEAERETRKRGKAVGIGRGTEEEIETGIMLIGTEIMGEIGIEVDSVIKISGKSAFWCIGYHGVFGFFVEGFQLLWVKSLNLVIDILQPDECPFYLAWTFCITSDIHAVSISMDKFLFENAHNSLKFELLVCSQPFLCILFPEMISNPEESTWNV